MEKIKTCWYNSGKDDSSDGGVESKVVLDQLDLAEVEEAADALYDGKISTQLQVDDHTEGDHLQGVAEEPEHLEYRLFVCVSWVLFEWETNLLRKPVLNMVRKGSTMK